MKNRETPEKEREREGQQRETKKNRKTPEKERERE